MTGVQSPQVYISLSSGRGAEYYLDTFVNNTGRHQFVLPTRLDPTKNYTIYIENAANNQRGWLCWEYNSIYILVSPPPPPPPPAPPPPVPLLKYPEILITPSTVLSLEEAEKLGERGIGAPYELTLSSVPVVSLNVTISIPKAEESQVDMQRDGETGFFKQTTLVFPRQEAGDTITKFMLTVFALADGIVEGNHYASIQHEISVSDASHGSQFFQPESGATTNVKLNLRDHASVSASVLFTPSGGSLTIDEGSDVTLQVSLSSRPDADVTITFTVPTAFITAVHLQNGTDPKLGGGGGASSFTMRFTPEAFDVKQSMLISNKRNSVADGRRTTQLTIGVDSLNPVYAALQPDPVPLTLVDDSSAGISVSPSSGLVVREGSANGAKVKVALNTRPLATVQLAFEEVDRDGNAVDSELRGLDITPRTLTFTVSNWDEAQSVTIFGRADGVVRGNIEKIVALRGSGDDASYTLTRTLSITVEDIDTASLKLSSTEIAFEEGKFKRLDVSLGSKPLSEVSVVVGCTGSVDTKDDAYCRDLASGAIAQPILAVATEPSDIASLDKTSTGLMLRYEAFSTDSGRAYFAIPADGRCRVASSNGELGRLQIPVASVSSDSYYSGLITNVTVTVTETDVAKICWGATTCEQALTNQVIDGVLDTSITVREETLTTPTPMAFALQTIPIAPVTIKLTSADNQLTVQPSSITINPADYEVGGAMPSGIFNIAAKDDTLAERTHSGILSVTVTASNDPCYSVLESMQLSVRIIDNELTDPEVMSLDEAATSDVTIDTSLGLSITFPTGWIPTSKVGSVSNMKVNVTEINHDNLPRRIDTRVFKSQTIVSIRIDALDSTDVFAVPVPISIPISSSTNPDLAGIIWTYGRSPNDNWNILEDTVFDPATGSIRGLANHFSIYASVEVLPTVVIMNPRIGQLMYTEDQPEALYPFDGADAVFEDGVTVLTENVCGLDISLVNSNDGANALDGSEDQLAFGPSSESSAGVKDFTAYYDASNLILYLRKGEADGSVLADDPAKGSQCAGKAPLVEYAKALRMIRYRNPSQNPKNTGNNRMLRVRVHEMHAKKTHTYPARIRVNSVNDPPNVQPSSNEIIYNEGATSRSLDGGLTVTDVDSTSLIRARVTIEPFDDSSDIFLFDSSNSAFEDGASLPTISKDSSNPSVGAYGISGAFPLLTYVNVLRSFKFKNDGPAIRFLKRTVTFRVEDIDGGVSNATRMLTIRERNDPPKAEDITLNVREDYPELPPETDEGLGILQATDPEGKDLTFRVVCPGSKGDLVLVNEQTGAFQYTPYSNAFGVDTIVYVARDEKGLDSNFAKLTVNIAATPDPPVAQSITYGQVGSPYDKIIDGYTFTANLPVSDADGDDNIKFIHIVTPPIYDKQAVQLTLAPGDSEQGTDQIRQRGINPIRYFVKEESLTALAGYDNFTYRVEDMDGYLSTTATVHLFITRKSQTQNKKPTMQPTQDAFVNEGGDTVFTINATDEYTKNLAYFYARGSRPELGTLHSCNRRMDASLPLMTQKHIKELCDVIVGPGDGSAAGDPVEDTEFIGYGGKVVYIAKRHRHGMDSFSVVAQDVQLERSNIGTLQISVREQNDVPVPACSTRSELGGVPPTAFAAQWRAGNMTEALRVLPDTPADIDGVDAGRIHKEAALHFRDVEATGMLKTQNFDELSILLPAELVGNTFDQPAAYTICNYTDSIIAVSRPIPPKDGRPTGAPSRPPPGSRPPPPELHPQPVRKDTLVALLAFDPDERTNGTLLYEIMDPPKMGNLTLVPRDELRVGAFEPSNVNFTVRQGEPMFMRFAAFEGVRGADAFRWTAFDSRYGRDLSSRGGFVVNISVLCPPGSIIDPGNETKCTPCQPGFYNAPDELDQVNCYPCAEGTFNSKHGATQCELCPEGTYEPSQGKTQCTPCPHSNQTTPTGSVLQNECKCGLGYWQTWPETWAHLFSNLDFSDSGVCVPCDPQRTVCNELGQSIPKPRSRKYFVNPKNAYDVALCEPEDSCLRHRTTDAVLSGKCAVGYLWPGHAATTENVTGDACTECQEKYYRDNRLCKKCPKEVWLVFVVFGVIVVALAPVLVKLAQASQGFSAVNIAISYFQINSTFRQFNFQWPKIVVDWFDFLAVLNLDVAWLAPECLVSWSFLNKMAMIQALPVLYLAIFGFNYAAYFVYILYQEWTSSTWSSDVNSDPQTPQTSRSFKHRMAIVYASAKEHAAANRGEHYNRVKSAFSLFLLWGYLIIGTVTFEYFNCSQVGDTWRMRVDPSVRCTWFPWIEESKRTKKGLHYRLAPLAVCSFFLYPLGILVHFLWVLYSNRDVLKNRYMIESWLSDAKDELDKEFKKEKQNEEEKEEEENRKSLREGGNMLSMAKARGTLVWIGQRFMNFICFTKDDTKRSHFEMLRENDDKSEEILSDTKVEAFKGENGLENVRDALRLRTLQIAYGFLFKRYESGTLSSNNIFVCFELFPALKQPFVHLPLTHP